MEVHFPGMDEERLRQWRIQLDNTLKETTAVHNVAKDTVKQVLPNNPLHIDFASTLQALSRQACSTGERGVLPATSLFSACCIEG